jgi:prepilin-type N-terminal cleavage/methylation domain-containing protein
MMPVEFAGCGVSRAARRGFTLIEILIVVAIVLLLASVLFVSFSGVMGRSDAARATATIETLKSNIDAFSANWGPPPPANMQDLAALMAPGQSFAANEQNEGIEALVLALRSRLNGGPFLDRNLFNDDERRTNLDMDRVSEAALNALDIEEGTSAELFEIVDPWGNPLIYVNIRELQQGRGNQTITLASGERIEISAAEALEALRHPVTGQLPGGYALWSLGPNGINEYGRGDDITSWPKYTE